MASRRHVQEIAIVEMLTRQFLTKIIGLRHPWRVRRSRLEGEPGSGKVTVELARRSNSPLRCPGCGKRAPGYDSKPRRWRHVDVCDHRLYIEASVPRVSCPDCGIRQVEVPWAEADARETKSLESRVILSLATQSVSDVTKGFGMSWGKVGRIMGRAVARGLSAMGDAPPPPHIGVDEVSFLKGHTYMTVVHDKVAKRILYVGEGRREESLAAFYRSLTEEQRAAIRCVSMDMWKPYIRATIQWVPGAGEKIAFDRFHVAMMLNKAVNLVRRREHKRLSRHGRSPLTGTMRSWLRNPENMDPAQRARFEELRSCSLLTARAWAIKELARSLWRAGGRQWAQRDWEAWCEWAADSGLGPIAKAAETVRKHLWGIVNAVVLRTDNSMAETFNSKIKAVKVRCRGFGSPERFKQAILFHMGGLELMPEGSKS